MVVSHVYVKTSSHSLRDPQKAMQRRPCWTISANRRATSTIGLQRCTYRKAKGGEGREGGREGMHVVLEYGVWFLKLWSNQIHKVSDRVIGFGLQLLSSEAIWVYEYVEENTSA